MLREYTYVQTKIYYLRKQNKYLRICNYTHRLPGAAGKCNINIQSAKLFIKITMPYIRNSIF